MESTNENNDLYFVDVPNNVEDSELNNNETYSGRLPAPPAPHDSEDTPVNQENEDEDQNAFFAELEDVPMASATKKKQINRGPKLDPNLLLGPRGLPALKTLSEQLNFKGPGHEYEDVGLLMSKIEHWAHRLYPKYTFGDTLEKLESLGNKGRVKSAMQKLRMGLPLDESMPLLDDKVRDDDEDSEIEYDDNEPVAPSFVNVYGSAAMQSQE